MSNNIPIKALHEAEGHIVTCETTIGDVYRGKLRVVEDNMNCQLSQVIVTYRNGYVAQLENIYIRGSNILFLILPDMLQNAPIFQKQMIARTAARCNPAIFRGRGRGRGNHVLVGRQQFNK